MGSIVEQDLKDLFSPYGELKRCEIKGRGQFAFVNFVEERDAERAHRALQDTEIRGARINIEWARGSGRYESRRSELVCYECREPGHFARDCRRARYRYSIISLIYFFFFSICKEEKFHVVGITNFKLGDLLVVPSRGQSRFPFFSFGISKLLSLG